VPTAAETKAKQEQELLKLANAAESAAWAEGFAPEPEKPKRAKVARIRLSPRQTKFVVLICGGMSVSKAAKEVGCSPKTASKWLHSAKVSGEITRLSRELMGEVEQKLRTIANAGLNILARTMTEESSPSLRLNAAKAALNAMLRVRSEDFAARLDQLERVIAGRKS
jgi:transposase-like protein